MKDEDELLKDTTEANASGSDLISDESYTQNQSSDEDNTAGVHKLRKPFMVDGETISEIRYDFDSVKPIQYKNLVARIGKKGQIGIPELDNNVQIGYFSLACGIPVSDLMRMPSTQDYTVICAMVRNFLLGVSATESEEE